MVDKIFKYLTIIFLGGIVITQSLRMISEPDTIMNIAGILIIGSVFYLASKQLTKILRK